MKVKCDGCFGRGVTSHTEVGRDGVTGERHELSRFVECGVCKGIGVMDDPNEEENWEHA